MFYFLVIGAAIHSPHLLLRLKEVGPDPPPGRGWLAGRMDLVTSGLGCTGPSGTQSTAEVIHLVGCPGGFPFKCSEGIIQ